VPVRARLPDPEHRPGDRVDRMAAEGRAARGARGHARRRPPGCRREGARTMTAPVPSPTPDAAGRSARASVVVPTYNRSASLLRALRSLAAQTFVPDEVVVVDDHSVDDTAEVCEVAVRDGLPFEFRY